MTIADLESSPPVTESTFVRDFNLNCRINSSTLKEGRRLFCAIWPGV
jgi:hypothetical protein